jgi:hypothetical protein
MRLDVTSESLVMTPIGFKPKELRTAGIRYDTLPHFQGFDDDPRASSNYSIGDSAFIVNNDGFSPEENARLIALGHPLAVGITMTRVDDAKAMRQPTASFLIRKN